MKHPALTRMMAVFLAVSCLAALFAGINGMKQNEEDNADALHAQQQLLERTDEAERLLLRLEADSADYDLDNTALEQQSDDYSSDNSQYRVDLATYTATRAGLQQGRVSMGEAYGMLEEQKVQMAEGRAAYEFGLKSYQEYLAGKELFEQSKQGLSMMQQQLDGLMQQKTALEQTVIMTEGQIAQQQTVQAELSTQISDFEERITQIDALLPELQAKSNADATAYQQLYDAYKPVEEFFMRVKGQFEADTAGGMTEEEARQKADSACSAEYELTYSELEKELERQLAALVAAQKTAEGSKGALDTANSEKTLAADSILKLQQDIEDSVLAVAELEKNRQESSQDLAMVAAGIPTLEQTIAETEQTLAATEKELLLIGPQLEKAAKEFPATEQMLLMGEAALAEGEKALDQAYIQLVLNERELGNTQQELIAEKARLETAYDDMSALRLDIKSYEQDRDSYDVLRAAIMSTGSIGKTVRAGGELISTARAEYDSMKSESERQYTHRRLVSWLAVAAGLLGLVAVLCGFEILPYKIMWLAALLCLGLSAAAEAVSLDLGRGLLYSVLFTGIFALLSLPLSIPGKRKI